MLCDLDDARGANAELTSENLGGGGLADGK